MPPDIMAAPSALAAGTPAGRTSGSSPPGNDPLAALFAALLAQSGGPTTSLALALPPPKSAVLPVTDQTTNKTATDPKKDNTATDKTFLAALPTLPPPILPIQMQAKGMRAMETKLMLPPTAGVTAGPKTMDTASALSSPSLKGTGAKPSGELILPPATAHLPVIPTTFPALLIPALTAPGLPAPATALPNVSRAAVAAAPVVPQLSVVPQVRMEASTDLTTVLTAEVSLGVSAPALASPVAALPKTFTALPELMPAAPITAAAKVDPIKADSIKSAAAPVLSAPATVPAAYVPAPHGFAVHAEALPASVPTASPEQTAATVAAAPSLPTLPALTTLLNIVAPSSVVVPKSTEGKTATDGTHATDSRQATDGLSSAIRPNSLPPVNMPEKGLKSAGAFADTNTRIPAAPAPTVSTEPALPVIGKRSEPRPAGDEDEVATALPQQAVPTSLEAGRTEAKPLTAAERAEMVRQVADGVGAMRLTAQPGKADQMTLQLHPKDWGQLQISVIVTPGSQSGAGQAVTAHIVTANPQVKAALENQGGDLRQALREAGLTLDKITVTVQSAAANAQAGTASGGHHGMNDGGYSKPPDQGTGMSGDTNAGAPSFAAFAGHSQGGRQGGQPPVPGAVYPTMELEREELPEAQMLRRPTLGQVDMRA